MPLFRTARSPGHRGSHAFSLIELLVVIAVAIALCALAIPALQGLKGSGDLTTAAYSLKDALDVARTYAMANNSYTWVGVFEEDSSGTPGKSGIGRLVIAIVASRDGSSIYNKALARASSPPVQAIPSSALIQVGKLIKIENVHILDATAQKIGTRLAGVVNEQSLVGLSSQPLLFSFQYPLSGTPVYTFGIRPVPTSNGLQAPSGIIQFNPQGEAISECGPVAFSNPCKEIAIQATHGTSVSNSPNIIALDVSCLTGQTTMYRP